MLRMMEVPQMLLLLLLLLLLLQLQGGVASKAFWGVSLQSCEGSSLRFLLTPEPGVGAASSTVRLLDPEGQLHLLKNDSACGTWVSFHPDGSLSIQAALGGCYVKAQGGSYRATVQIEGPGADGRKTSYKQELRCPEPLLALDKPSPNLCSNIEAADRLPCATAPVTPKECEELGCCYANQDRRAPCYFANKVTARCSPEGHFSVVVSRNVTLPPLRLESLHLVSNPGQARCSPVSRNQGFAAFHFPVSACGTTFKEVGSQRVYENELVADRKVQVSRSGSITRDSHFRLTVRCSYSAEDSLPISVHVAILPPPPAVAQQGPLALEMRIARDEKFSSYFGDSDYPVVKVLHDPVHVEVRLLRRKDPTLVLALHDCWATPSTNPLQKPDWPLLEAGCPYPGDNYQTQMVPVSGLDSGLAFPSHYQRFIVSTFTFVDAASQRMLNGPVYFHCSASACVPSGQESCRGSCEEAAPQRRSRRAAAVAAGEPGEWRTLVSSEGPVAFFGKATEVALPSDSLPGSRRLQAGRMSWDNALALAAGTVALMATGMAASVALKRRWGGSRWGAGPALSRA